MDDATLDQFDVDGKQPDDPEGGETAATGQQSGEDGEGADTTLSWTPDGEPCADCGTVVERRWRREAGLVCEDCLDWE